MNRLAVHAAWLAAGSPTPNWSGKAKTERSAPEMREGVCALTGESCLVVDIRHVLSDLFTTWDRLQFRNRPGAGLSLPAVWAFRERAHLSQPHAMTNGKWRMLMPSELLHALKMLPVRPDTVVCVPQSRQKHVVPFAELGTVRVDDETIEWKSSDVDRLATLARLRDFGFGEAALAEPAPRWPILLKLDTTQQSEVVNLWPSLNPWRKHSALLDIACRATRKDNP